jgi:hypothetical protein
MANNVPLPDGYTLGKSYEYGIDVNLGTYDTPVWQPVRRISGFAPAPTPKTQDSQTYDDLGSDNSDVTGWSWVNSFNVQVNRHLTTGLYLPEVEYLLARTRPSATGETAIADVRWYHKPEVGAPNPNDAFRGLCTVAPARQNTGPGGEIESLGITLTGKGPSDPITNPWTGWSTSAVPTISTVTPAARGTGQQVTLTGTGFTGVTAVSIGGTPLAATAYSVISSTTIVVTLPSASAGSINFTVTNAAGVSAAKAYTRAA